MKHVLIVEDTLSLSKLYSMLVEDYNFKPVTAFNAHEALKLMSDLELAALIVDNRMPGMCGEELINQVVLSGYNRPILYHSSDFDIKSLHDNVTVAFKDSNFDYIKDFLDKV